MALKSSQCYHHQSETERSTEGNDIIKIMTQKIPLTWTTLGLLMNRILTGSHIYLSQAHLLVQKSTQTFPPCSLYFPTVQ